MFFLFMMIPSLHFPKHAWLNPLATVVPLDWASGGDVHHFSVPLKSISHGDTTGVFQKPNSCHSTSNLKSFHEYLPQTG